MDLLSLTQSNWFIIGPVAKVLGFVMNGIYEFLDMLSIPNIGISIILFTLITKALMLPLSIKQQKFTKLNSIMSPELQAIQAYDVWHEKTMCGKTSMGVVRTTYVIDENGRIEWAKEKVKPEVNAGEILEYLG